MEEYSAPILRFYLLNGHYRSPIDFSDSNLKESMSAYRRLEGTYNRLVESKSRGDQTPSELLDAIEICRNDFISSMNDDFNTREGIAALFQLTRVSNNYDFSELSSEISKALIEIFKTYGHNVLGLFNEEVIDDILEVEITNMLTERALARDSKDWSTSDSIRDKLQDMGIEIQDTPEGTKWRRI